MYHDPVTGEIDDFANEAGVEVVQRDKPKMSLRDYARKMARKSLNLFGAELPDPVPMAPPVGFLAQPSMMDHVMDLIKSNDLRKAAEAAGIETLEESDDFDIRDPDDYEPMSAYEMDDDYEPISSFLQKAKPFVDAANQQAAADAAELAQRRKERAEATTEPSPDPAAAPADSALT